MPRKKKNKTPETIETVETEKIITDLENRGEMLIVVPVADMVIYVNEYSKMQAKAGHEYAVKNTKWIRANITKGKIKIVEG